MFNTVKAQHCGFDFLSLIAVDIHSKNNPEAIPNLEIELIGEIPNNFSLKTLKFEQGLDFPFLKDYYALVVPSDISLQNLKIKITDIDGAENGGFFKEIQIPLYNIDKYSLCGRYDMKNFVSGYGERLYKPIELVHYSENEKFKSQPKKTVEINNCEISYSTKYTNFNKNLPEQLTFYLKEDEKNEVFNLETNGAYIGKIECFKVNNDDFVYIRLDETSGIQYGTFYHVDVKKKKAKKVIEDYGNFKIPDSLENYSGFGILKDSNNKFYSALDLRSKKSNKIYQLKRNHQLIKKGDSFTLKVISETIKP